MASLDRKMITKFCGNIEKGMSIKSASECCGVSNRAVYKWLKQGRETEDENSIYAKFHKEHEEAKERSFENLLDVINKHASLGTEVTETTERFNAKGELIEKLVRTKHYASDWRAAAKLATLRHPERCKTVMDVNDTTPPDARRKMEIVIVDADPERAKADPGPDPTT